MPDYLQLFEPSAPWPRAAASVVVFKMSTQFLGGASDDVLRRVFNDLRRRHIFLAWEGLMLTATPTCGNHVEGYAGISTVKVIAERIRRLGGDLRYVAMDEPLWFGHFSTLPNACRTPINAIAREIARKVSVIRSSFPNAKIGDIEVIATSVPPNWVNELLHWIDAYREAVGEPLAFFEADVNWANPWRTKMPELASRLHAAGVKFGIIYDGDPDDATGLAWTRHAEQRFVAVESGLGLTPDQAILQTWMPQPDHMLPETQPGTMTWLVDRYLAAPTRLTLHRAGDRVAGLLTDAAGHPIAGVPVTLSVEAPGDWATPAMHTVSGQVPANAAAAVLALRINVECGCSGPADIGVGPMRYHDDRTGQTVSQAFRPSPASATIAGLVRFQARPAAQVEQNAPGFPVIPGDPFTLQVPLRTDPASASSGYVAVIFLDAQGKEVERLRLPFEPAEWPIGTPTTDAQGRFSVVPDPEILRRASGFRVEFGGTAQYRMAEAGIH